MLCQHSQFNFVSFWTLTKNSKWSRTKCLECHAKNWPVGGEPALATTKKKKEKVSQPTLPTLLHEYVLCPVPLIYPWHLSFHLRNWKHGNYSSPIAKVSWAYTEMRHSISGVSGCKHKLFWECTHRQLNSWAD